jgi:hypothetical protein
LKRQTARLALLLALTVAAFAATAGAASTKTSCGEKVINDWYGSKSGRLSHTYPLHCYRDALKIIKHETDILVYSNARQDILVAMQLAIASGKGGGGLGPPDALTYDAYPSFYGGPDARHGGDAPTGDRPLTIRPTEVSNNNPAFAILHNSNPSSVPLPAIVLGSIAILLLALGSAAYLVRRRQTRRQRFRPQTAPDTRT